MLTASFSAAGHSKGQGRGVTATCLERPEVLAQVPDRISRETLAEWLPSFPREWRRHVVGRWTGIWHQTKGLDGERRRAANSTVRELREKVQAVPLDVTADDDAIRAKAQRLAERCQRATLTQCATWARSVAVALPEVDNEEGMLARLRDELWWRAQLRKNVNRALENTGRALGLVNHKRDRYVTGAGLNRRRQQKRRNHKTLEAMLAISELGDEISVSDLWEASVSNPALRRNEMMARMAGYQQIAEDLGHVAYFYTLTTPSAYHASPQRWNGQVAPKWNKTTVQEAQAYLQQVWARMRAELKRQDLRCYGLRVAEPHQDGTPHWHMLLWFESHEAAAQFAWVLWRYGMAEAGKEPGAAKHRIEAKYIDPERGTAVGYVCKYVAKNIDGFALDPADPAADREGLLGADPVAIAERVDAWASIHGIRQFQFIGGPSVTVWRQLRKLSEEKAGVLEACREAADRGDWSTFVAAMGGPFAARKDQPIRPAYWQEIDLETGELPLTRFGDPAAARLFGVWVAETPEPIGQKWRIVLKEKKQCESQTSSPACTAPSAATKSSPALQPVSEPPRLPPVTAVDRRCGLTATLTAKGEEATGIPAGTVLEWEEAKRLPPGLPEQPNAIWFLAGASRPSGADAPPWSSVNNCTDYAEHALESIGPGRGMPAHWASHSKNRSSEKLSVSSFNPAERSARKAAS